MEPVAPELLHLLPIDPRYPSRLRGVPCAPASLSVRGGSLQADQVVAVVGSRDAHPEAERFASALASQIARRGAVVASGGALGIDAAAHRGALDAGGRTWVVAGTGCAHCFPPEHAALFDRVAAGPGAMLWPFAPPRTAWPPSFRARNRVLAALSDAVVVVQASLRSGALNAASAAQQLGRPLWVVTPAAWHGPEFDGSRALFERGARPLATIEALLQSLGLGPTAGPQGPSPTSASHAPPRSPTPPRPLSDIESAIVSALSHVPLHLDEIASRAHSAAPAVTVALLTLALDDVVVEGPPGFFRLPVHDTSSQYRK